MISLIINHCSGCLGCTSDNYVFPTIETIEMNNQSLTEKAVSGDNIFGGKGFSAASTNNFRSKSKVSFGGPAVTVNSAIISFGLTTIVKEVSSQCSI